MSYRAFLLKGNNQYFQSDEFVSENVFCAFYGFSILGWEIIPFTSKELPEDIRRGDVVVAGIGTFKRAVEQMGLTVPDTLDYPIELEEFYGRKIWSDNLKNVYMNQESWPIFVKPKTQKLFTGKFIQSTRDVIGLSADESIEVWCSEPVDFISEWRCYVRYGQIIDVRNYKGDWSKVPNKAIVERAIKEFTSQTAGYGIDFGVTSDGRTLIVEVNDGFSLGSYGLAPIKYAQLLTARWSEIMMVPDPLHLMGTSLM
jgi:hypothetical protein